MKFNETRTYSARWSHLAEILIGNYDCIAENTIIDYQGSVDILCTDGEKYYILEYSYGSCAGCDPWEEKDEFLALSDMRTSMSIFDDKNHLKNYIKNLPNDSYLHNVFLD